MNEGDRLRQLASSLHRLRSALARVQAEAELLEMDGVPVQGVLEGASMSLAEVALAQELTESVNALPVRAVLLDDDERLACMTARRMAREGLDTCVVLSLPSALRWAALGATLLADVSVLEAADEDQLAELRSLRPILTTGASPAAAEAAAARYNARAFLIKPIDPVALMELFRAHPA